MTKFIHPIYPDMKLFFLGFKEDLIFLPVNNYPDAQISPLLNYLFSFLFIRSSGFWSTGPAHLA